MKKVMKVLVPVLQGFVFCAMTLQIVLGVIYIGANFLTVPQFKDTAVYLQMAEHFVADEYTGLLYPFLVKLSLALPLIPYQIPIYILQIAAAVYCVYYFVYTWTERKALSFVFSVWINTIPFVAQAHVTVLPHSLTMSCLVLMFLQVLKGSRDKRTLSVMEWAELLCSYMILAQLTRGYLFVGTLFMIWAACLQVYRYKHRLVLFFVSMLVCAGMFSANVAIYSASEHPGYYGRIQKTISSVLFQRVGTKTLMEKYLKDMPPEVSECYEGSELNRISKYPYKIETEFGPSLENKYGRERADAIYRELSLLGLSIATKDNAVAILEDSVSYLLPIAGYYTWQDGDTKGASSWNYQQFMEQAPVWSHRYVKISHAFWTIGFGGSLLGFLLVAVCTKKLRLHLWLPAFLYICLFAAIMALNGTDTYDYKWALFPMIISYVPMTIFGIRYIFNKG